MVESLHVVAGFRPRAFIVCLLLCGWSAIAFSQVVPPPVSRLVELSGSVRIASVEGEVWHLAKVGEALRPGDRVRTDENSRATLLLTDRSLVRLNPLTVIEIQAPHDREAGRKRFKLRSGTLFFLNREKPSSIEFETPLATGAIRGTEFVLRVGAETESTELELREGEVELRREAEVAVLNGEGRLKVEKGLPIIRSPIPNGEGWVQWFLYYPVVLAPQDLRLAPSEEVALESSRRAYLLGDTPAAVNGVPDGFRPESDGAKLYLASLRLAVGDLVTAERWMSGVSSNVCASTALREMMAVVRGTASALPDASDPDCASAWMSRSYRLQSRGSVDQALEAARRVTAMAPDFGAGWARLAELEFASERWREVAEALREAERLSPRSPKVAALDGFRLLALRRFAAARKRFEGAVEQDAGFPDGWLGRGLAKQSMGETEAAREDLLVAAGLEPQRALFRSYLAKAWAASGNDSQVEKELQAAKRLDPADPTAWLYSALHHYQTLHLNQALRDLETSWQLNDNRRLFRSRLMLDRDRAIRSANLASIYDRVGLKESAEQAAARSVEEHPTEFSGHLFVARSLDSAYLPRSYDLRDETRRQSELLIGNLLAPIGAGNLSQFLSQQDHLNYFEAPPLGGVSLSEYRSTGDWAQTGTLFGSLDHLSYALDLQYVTRHGQAPNRDLESTSFSFQAKQQLTPQDSLYWQISTLNREGGDLAAHYDPSQNSSTLRFTERQEPNLFLGYHHEWSPGSHTLMLVSRLQDNLRLHQPEATQLFFRNTAGQIVSVQTDPFFSRDTESKLELYSVELQQLWESAHHSVIAGGRYQTGDGRSEVNLSRLLTAPYAPELAETGLERLSGYAYYTWKPISQIRLTAGLTYDRLSYPRNADLPPLDGFTEDRARLSPSLALHVSPWRGGSIRALYARSLGGLYFDGSVRLEPTQLAGFGTAYRSLLPESAAGLLAGAEFETWAVGLDQILPTGSYFGASGELRGSQGDRSVGAFTNNGLPPIPTVPIQVRQQLDFTEKTVGLYGGQLLDDAWSLGSRYRLTESALIGRFPEIPGTVSGIDQLSQDDRSLLHHVEGFLLWNHPSGFFAQWTSSYYRQSNRGYSPDRPGDSFWQHDAYVGYTFPHRRAELRLGLLNLFDQDYQLNPLNWMSQELPRRRTLYLSVRLQF